MNYIYCITNLINNKRYVGKTTQSIEERFKQHCRDSRKGKYKNRPLYDAMNKYGIENFKIECLEKVEDSSILSEREIYWIHELNSYGSNGYNATEGGDGTILYDYKEIVDLARLGYTSKQICNKIGCCDSTVYSVLKAHKVKYRQRNTKLIAQYDLAGNYIQTFWGAGEVQKYLNDYGITDSKKASTSINKCCKGIVKQAYGYIWKYLPEPK